jgi:hypothetical protein
LTSRSDPARDPNGKCPFTHEWKPAADAWSRRASLERLDRLSRLLDIAFPIPGTRLRFSVEAILRLIPGIGDVAASALSCCWVLFIVLGPL